MATSTIKRVPMAISLWKQPTANADANTWVNDVFDLPEASGSGTSRYVMWLYDSGGTMGWLMKRSDGKIYASLALVTSHNYCICGTPV